MQPRECQLRGRDFTVAEEPEPPNMGDLTVLPRGSVGLLGGVIKLQSHGL
jgi:hypothetical protein